MVAKRKKTTQHFQYISEEGLAALKQQLQAFEKDYRELRGKLAEMRQVKDAEDYDLVEDTMRLAFLEKEISRLQFMIRNCRILEQVPEGGTVQLGSRVRLESEGSEIYCTVVCSLEADPSEGKISDQSPLGRALLGKMVNALVEVVAPHKSILYRIVGIER